MVVPCVPSIATWQCCVNPTVLRPAREKGMFRDMPVRQRATRGGRRAPVTTRRGNLGAVMSAPVEHETLANRIRDHLGEAEVEVTGEGNRFDVRVKSFAFEGLSRVRRQQLVYEAIGDLIRDGSVHAVTIRTIAAGDP